MDLVAKRKDVIYRVRVVLTCKGLQWVIFNTNFQEKKNVEKLELDKVKDVAVRGREPGRQADVGKMEQMLLRMFLVFVVSKSRNTKLLTPYRIKWKKIDGNTQHKLRKNILNYQSRKMETLKPTNLLYPLVFWFVHTFRYDVLLLLSFNFINWSLS